ncbi:MAG: DNA polymerase III subunit delta [Bacteroidetes bacterium]|jgi:DNA polymerase-3 subunit delta'|nr:DNA polymerase III subunit delta [Bacteroidota bacterium]
MQFSQVIGQQAVKQNLIQSVRNHRVSHAQLFLGSSGSGSLALALAYAQYINCSQRTENDSCGVCPSCLKISKLTHPDLHFIFPTTTNKKVKKDPESALFIDDWRGFVTATKAYGNLQAWYEHLDVEKKQGTIFIRDAATILRNLSLKSYEAEYKVMIIWMAEKLNAQAANKLLKLLEEPPAKTLFLLLAEQQDQILPTVLSRTYKVKVPKINDQELLRELCDKHNCREADAHDAVMMADGDWPLALHFFENAEEEKYNFQTFQQWMRLCFKVSVVELIDFVDKLRPLGREKQKTLLAYGLQVFRNALLFNNQLVDLVRLPSEEKSFNEKFAPFVNPANLLQMSQLMEEGIRQIERNGFGPLIFMDISLKMIKLLKQKAPTAIN